MKRQLGGKSKYCDACGVNSVIREIDPGILDNWVYDRIFFLIMPNGRTNSVSRQIGIIS